jgi:hypothetical protein
VGEERPAGVKTQFILLALSARLKPCPGYKALLKSGFSAACKAQRLFLAADCTLRLGSGQAFEVVP